jgi:hypothetical protein
MWCISGMTTCNKPRIAAEILNFDVEGRMETDILVGWRNCFVLIQYLELNSDVLHLLPYRILPKSVFVIFVQYDTVIPTLRDFNPKLVGSLVSSFVDGRYHTNEIIMSFIWEDRR